ncbi:MAG: hypothetical protein IPF90_10790 [Actinomycetales bacterium]|nr:hypothetical protein [Candidatus Phosphoribacter baldrii]
MGTEDGHRRRGGIDLDQFTGTTDALRPVDGERPAGLRTTSLRHVVKAAPARNLPDQDAQLMARDLVRHGGPIEPASDPNKQLALALSWSLTLGRDFLADDLNDGRIELIKSLGQSPAVPVDQEVGPLADPANLAIERGSGSAYLTEGFELAALRDQALCGGGGLRVVGRVEDSSTAVGLRVPSQ